ncbi:hypothetical protein A2533_00225 [Candidatus Falkowbacteria bacterium RIFOXYD2_FULL_35_9]|uniref:Uncharacterized protein n=1 Tax=Candidatus Falkowbacteria bacterium RIFOXYC2_FULL_36_12 TaxID=1798002 RepID=A0A1F5T3A0_9BACT|nr:MAG: hypothetical protein A2478_01890 [Candidatus Falkowbacteria bacterium RIFOXYC2_FULL_36_12]OGF33923.1 MAG: hypothetical protein A2223_02360 [Candidatus Falkowbacteria bacterium RIFOXYA2_FULL_35_8]OGF45790.1 MAG: hypothetical protein A2533_00225 [Candidatus Falkowbacteria bacterium RIFOXYD2_FULL_35_9]
MDLEDIKSVVLNALKLEISKMMAILNKIDDHFDSINVNFDRMDQMLNRTKNALDRRRIANDVAFIRRSLEDQMVNHPQKRNPFDNGGITGSRADYDS